MSERMRARDVEVCVMSERMVSADEARAMLDDVPDLAEAVAAGQDTLSNAATGGGRYGAAVQRASELLGDVERLARTVLALHAIIEGRAVAPTDAELAAHAAAGGAWLARLYDGTLVVMRADARQARGVMVREAPYVARWWPLASDGRPCAWPVVAERPAGCICDFSGGKHRFSCARQQPTLAVTRNEDGTFRVAGTEVDRG